METRSEPLVPIRVADRAYVLERGRVVREGEVVLLRNDPQVIRVYMGRGIASSSEG